MLKQAQYNPFYNLGVQAALGHTKTAGISANALRKMLSAGGPESAAFGHISGLEPFRNMGNFLADPLRRVPGIRG